MSKILFVGGGSVGHIAPAVAVWEACRTLLPKATAHFVCSPRPDDKAFLKHAGLPYDVLDAPRLVAPRSVQDVVAFLLFLVHWRRAVHRATKILETMQPDIIFSKGGYVSLPLCAAAHKKGIPIILHESDAVSGRANRIVSRWALRICLGFPPNIATSQPSNIATLQPSNIATFTGNPVRTEITKGSRAEGLRITGFDGRKPILLVIGGSQGARTINEAIESSLEDLALRCDIIHITGRGKLGTKNCELGTKNYFPTEFAYESLPHFYACADIALSRAGAGSIAELSAVKVPTILVPLRGVGHDHQYKNAVTAAATGGCILLEENMLAAKLLSTVHSLVTDRELRVRMAADMQKINTRDAAVHIAKIIVQTLDSPAGDQ